MEIKRAALVTRAREIVKREAQAVSALADYLDERLARVVELLLNCQGRVLVTGAGTLNAISRRFAHLLSCSGAPALYIRAADSVHGGAGAIKPGAVVYVISKGGAAPRSTSSSQSRASGEPRSLPRLKGPIRRWGG